VNNPDFKIAVIDSGIDTNHPRLKDANISGIYFKKNNDSYSIINEFDDLDGHGTACASIIHKMVPDIAIVAIKILTEEQTADEYLLYEAIKWCLSDAKIKIINISLGCATKNPFNKLYDVCEKAYKNNVFIVAATHNDPTIECYPAYFPNVFSVCAGNTKDHQRYGILNNEKINIIAKGTTQRVAWRNGTFKITMGASFATAHFSGILGKFVHENQNLTRGKLNSVITHNANATIKPLHFIRSKTIRNDFGVPLIHSHDYEAKGELIFGNKKQFEDMKKIALFPSSEKEMNSIIKFEHLCRFSVIKLIDYPRTLTDTNKDVVRHEVLRRLPREDELKEIDTFVIGYFYEHLFDANVEFGKKIIEIGIRHNKNFIIWSLALKDYIKKITSEKTEYNGKIIIPSVTEKDYAEILQYRYLPSVSVPSILVIGTSNKQGKFTTQLKLLELLEREGYHVELIPTEPQGILFGAEQCFPYGYESTVEIDETLWVNYLVSLMKGLQKYKNPHLFLSGIQSNLVPRSKAINELSTKNAFASLRFLTGFQPDGIVCAINPQDTEEIIERTIKMLEIYSNGKILFFVMTPWFRNFNHVSNGRNIKDFRTLTQDELEKKANEFSQKIGYPVLNIMNDNNGKLILNIIEETFAKEKYLS
jgi:hypothetical protein